MSLRIIVIMVVIAGFGALTLTALLDVGYLGIIEPHFQSWSAAQVFFDLVIVAVLACLWMLRDARTSGVPAWPFVVLTLAAGCFGPLFYLLVRELAVRELRTSAGELKVSTAGAG